MTCVYVRAVVTRPEPPLYLDREHVGANREVSRPIANHPLATSATLKNRENEE